MPISVDVSALWAERRQSAPEIYGLDEGSTLSKLDRALRGPATRKALVLKLRQVVLGDDSAYWAALIERLEN